MNTQFTTSEDGTRIAYDVSGDGLPIILLHGFSFTRQERYASYEDTLGSTTGEGCILPDLNHRQEFSEIDQSLPEMWKFMAAGA